MNDEQKLKYLIEQVEFEEDELKRLIDMSPDSFDDFINSGHAGMMKDARGKGIKALANLGFFIFQAVQRGKIVKFVDSPKTKVMPLTLSKTETELMNVLLNALKQCHFLPENADHTALSYINMSGYGMMAFLTGKVCIWGQFGMGEEDYRLAVAPYPFQKKYFPASLDVVFATVSLLADADWSKVEREVRDLIAQFSQTESE